MEPEYFRCRFWVLDVERIAAHGEEGCAYEDLSGIRLFEREAVLKGPNRDVLEAKANAERLRSYDRYWMHFGDQDILKQLSGSARITAMAAYERYYQSEDSRIERREAIKKAEALSEQETARLRAVPTISSFFQDLVESRLKLGRIQSNTAETYRYEAAAFNIVVSTAQGDRAFGELQLFDVTTSIVDEWFGKFSARITKFGRLPTRKTCLHVLGHLVTVRKELKRKDSLKAYGSALEHVDGLLEEIRVAKNRGDGWRNRHRLMNEDVLAVVEACQTDAERGLVALLLAGSRPPSEPAAVEWSDLDYDSDGNLWWHVQNSAIKTGGVLDLRNHTKTLDVDYRQLNIARRFSPWIESLRGRSPRFVLGDGENPMDPDTIETMIGELLERAGVTGVGISSYSLRHTVSDEIERILGERIRDLVTHGPRERTTGNMHYSHALRDRRRAALITNGLPYGEHMVWTGNSDRSAELLKAKWVACD